MVTKHVQAEVFEGDACSVEGREIVSLHLRVKWLTGLCEDVVAVVVDLSGTVPVVLVT